MSFLQGVVSALNSAHQSSGTLAQSLSRQSQGNVVAAGTSGKLAGSLSNLNSILEKGIGIAAAVGKSYYDYSDATKRAMRGTELMGKSLDEQRGAQTRLISSSNKWVRSTGESAERAAAFTVSFERSIRRAFNTDVTEEAMDSYQKSAKIAMRFLNATSTEIQQLQEKLVGEMRFDQGSTEKLFDHVTNLTQFGMDSQRMMETLSKNMDTNMQLDQQTRQAAVNKQMESAVLQYKAAVDFSRSVDKVANPGKERMKQAGVLGALSGVSLEETLRTMEGARRGDPEMQRSLQQMIIKASSTVGVDQQAIEKYQQNTDPLGSNISAQIIESTLGRYGLGNLADIATFTENEKRLKSGMTATPVIDKDLISSESDTLAESFAMMRGEVDKLTVRFSEWLKSIPGAEEIADYAKRGIGLYNGFNGATGGAGSLATSAVGAAAGHYAMSRILGGGAAAGNVASKTGMMASLATKFPTLAAAGSKIAPVLGKAALPLDFLLEGGRLGLDSGYRNKRHNQTDTEDTIGKGLWNRFTSIERLSPTANIYDIARSAHEWDKSATGAKDSEQALNAALERKRIREQDPNYTADLERRRARIAAIRARRAGVSFTPDENEMTAGVEQSLKRNEIPVTNRRPLPRMAEIKKQTEVRNEETKVSDSKMHTVLEQGSRRTVETLEKLIRIIDGKDDDTVEFMV